MLANTGASPQKTNYLGRPRMFAGIAQKSNLLPGKSLKLTWLMVSIGPVGYSPQILIVGRGFLGLASFFSY